MTYRVATGSASPVLVVGGAYSTQGEALTAAKGVYATIPAPDTDTSPLASITAVVSVYDDQGHSTPGKYRNAWEWLDGISVRSWLAGQYSLSEYAQWLRGGEQDNDYAEGPAPVDDAPYLEVNTDGYACVYVDFDDAGNPAPYTPAPGAWQFRIGTSGDFDTPDAPNRNLGPLPPNTVVEAQDGAGELPTLTALVLSDTYAYPVPQARFGLILPDGVTFALPTETSDDDPLGSPVLVVHEQEGPIGYGQSENIYNDASGHDPDLGRNVFGDGDEYGRYAHMHIARPLSPLPDDDGHSAGFWFRAIEIHYLRSDRLISQTADGYGGIYTLQHRWQADQSLIGNVTRRVGYGLQPMPVWTVGMGTDPGDVSAGQYNDPGPVPSIGDYGDVWPDEARFFDGVTGQYQTDSRVDWVSWQVEAYLQAVYVQRGLSGEEWEYKSNKTPVSLNLSRFRQYPKPPQHFIPQVSTCFQGASGGVSWQESAPEFGTPSWGWAAIPVFDQYGGQGSYLPGDTLSYSCPAVQGASGYHIFVKRDGTPNAAGNRWGVVDTASSTSPCDVVDGSGGATRCAVNADPLGYLLANGAVMPNSCSSIAEYVGAGSLDSEQLGSADCQVITADAYPIMATFANGGTVPYDCDTVVYTDNTGARQTAPGQGPLPGHVAYYAPKWEAGGSLAEAKSSSPQPICLDPTGAQTGSASGPGLPPDPTPPPATTPYKGSMTLYVIRGGEGVPLPQYDADDSVLNLDADAPADIKAAYWDAPDTYPGLIVTTGAPGLPVPCPANTGFVGWSINRRMVNGDSVPEGPIFAQRVTAYINSDDSLRSVGGVWQPVTVGAYVGAGARVIGSFVDSYGVTVEVFDRPPVKA